MPRMTIQVANSILARVHRQDHISQVARSDNSRHSKISETDDATWKQKVLRILMHSFRVNRRSPCSTVMSFDAIIQAASVFLLLFLDDSRVTRPAMNTGNNSNVPRKI